MKLKYVPTTLRRIRAETKNNHEITNIDVAIRTWIIALGIHKRISHRLYQRSRVGLRLFHRIYTINRTNVPSAQKGYQDGNGHCTPCIKQ